MNGYELRWLAGWLEANGSFLGDDRRVRIEASTRDEDVARRAAELLGASVRAYPANGRTLWRVDLGRRSEVVELARRLRPHLGVRRRAQVDELLAASDRSR